MLFFALQGSHALGDRVAAAGGFARAPHEEREFDGGEHKARPLVDVRHRDVFVLHSLNGEPGGSANDKLLRLLFFAATCREHGASRVTAIAPYLAYSRKDRQTKPHDPVTTRYVAGLFEAAGVDRVVTLEVHNPAAFQNAFRCETLHLSTDRLLADHIAARGSARAAAVVSPDPGGVKRAQLAREALEEATGTPAAFGFMEKRRSGGVVSGTQFAGEVEGRAVYILDDMICGGGTILRAAEAVRARGAAEIHAVATHGLLTEAGAVALAGTASLDSVVLTDSAALPVATRRSLGERLRLVPCAPLIAAAIKDLHGAGADGNVAHPRGSFAPLDGRQ